jgi:hypothetical protein
MIIDPDDFAELRNHVKNARKGVRKAYGTFSASPIILVVLGVAALAIGAAGLTVEISTSEALILGTSKNLVIANWGVFTQPYQIFAGGLDLKTVLAYVYGWTVEVVDLVFAFALGHAYNALKLTNKTVAKFYGVASFVLIGLNAWSNINSLLGVDPVLQFLVALAIAIAVVVFPVVGLALIERGISEF